MRKIEKKDPMVWISKFTYSSNLAKTESLLIFVEQKLSSGPMCDLLLSPNDTFFYTSHFPYRKMTPISSMTAATMHSMEWWSGRAVTCE